MTGQIVKHVCDAIKCYEDGEWCHVLLPPTIEVMAEVALKLVWHVLKRDAGDEIAVNVLEYVRKHGWVEELT